MFTIDMRKSPNGMLDEGRGVGGLSGSHECADFVELIVLEGDGDLSGCHTKNHPMHDQLGLSPL